MRDLGQERAANALWYLKVTIDTDTQTDSFKKRYRAYVDRLGPAIVMNGLGQALATERAAAGPNPKDEDEMAHNQVYLGVQQWLCRPSGGVYSVDEDLLSSLVSNEQAPYLRAQAEALAWLVWHKKFCRATLPKGEG